MEIFRADEVTVCLSGIDPFLADLMRQIPAAADPEGSLPALRRIFSSPGNEKDIQFQEEWLQYVQPELRHVFQSAMDVVREDLGKLVPEQEKSPTSYSLRIGRERLESWLNGLNQARIVLAARNGFTQVEMEAESPIVIETARDMSLLQIHLYEGLQGAFLQLL